jgi:hypothetical protein
MFIEDAEDQLLINFYAQKRKERIFLHKNALKWLIFRVFGNFTVRGRSIINVQVYFDQLFRGHKKQFSDQFLVLDNK